MAWQRTDESCSTALHSCEIDLGAGECDCSVRRCIQPTGTAVPVGSGAVLRAGPLDTGGLQLGQDTRGLGRHSSHMKKVTARPRPVLSPLRAIVISASTFAPCLLATLHRQRFSTLSCTACQIVL
jgi:hypothetical protein